MKRCLVYIIVLNWNGLDETINSIHSLKKINYNNYKIIVVDNGSKADEGKALKNIFKSNVEIIKNDKNLGFTGGMNTGIKHAKKFTPDYYLLLNNDTEVDKDFLTNLIDTMEHNKKIGIISPTIYDYYKREKIIFSGGYTNWLLGKTFHKRDSVNTIQFCNFITGCCFLIRAEVIKKVGLLDERFFTYFEDAAYSIRIRTAGYLCASTPMAKIYHIEGASTKKTGSFKTYLIARNRILFIKYYAPFWVKLYFPFFNFAKLLFALSYFSLTKQYKRTRAYFKGYIDGTFGKGGLPAL